MSRTDRGHCWSKFLLLQQEPWPARAVQGRRISRRYPRHWLEVTQEAGWRAEPLPTSTVPGLRALEMWMAPTTSGVARSETHTHTHRPAPLPEGCRVSNDQQRAVRRVPRMVLGQDPEFQLFLTAISPLQMRPGKRSLVASALQGGGRILPFSLSPEEE